uniref:NACHT domain-containing protein n=1 Tax=Frankia sp. Cr1 TaxID=3073931 RepID=UPI002AD44B71
MGGRGGKRWQPVGLLVGLAGTAAAVAPWRGGRGTAGTLAAVVAAGGLWVAWAGYAVDRRDTPAGDVDVAGVADRLADQVGRQWAAEARRQDLNRPPLEVSWQPADPSLSPPWSDLRRLAASGAGWRQPAQSAAGPHELAGTGGELVGVLDRVPTGRLVVLGEPGSGKTMLLIRLVLDLLTRRTPGSPVPLLVPLASFRPDRHDLHRWLETQIIREHPWLATTAAAGISRARALLDAGLILPVLDGLDEIRSGGRDQAIAAINTTLRDGQQLVLSCRVTAFRHAIRPGPGRLRHIEGAAAIRLCRLNPAQVAAYLTETGGSAGTARWIPVLTALATAPTAPVVLALATPLMASLARTIYN